MLCSGMFYKKMAVFSAPPPRRIMLVGSSNSGKTTLSHFLKKTLQLPLYEIDDLAWQPHWQMRTTEEVRQRVADVVSQPEWILIGNYGNTQDLSWPVADVVIWLDLPRFVVMRRVIWRCVHRTWTQTPVCNGNYESFQRSFLSRDSLILWVWNHYANIQERYEARMKKGGTPVIRLRTPREVQHFQRYLKALTSQP